MRIALLLLALVISTLFFANHARSQALLTPRDEFLTALAQATEEPGHAIWFYISGLISGANAASVIHTGEPAICDGHQFEEIDKTEDTIMQWLVESGQLQNPDIFLELAAPLAFAHRYPCTKI